MQENAENVVSRVLEPGEKSLWAGRPHVDPAMEHRSQVRRRNKLIILPVAALAIFWITDSLPVSSPSAIMENLPFEPKFLWVIAAPFLLIIAARLFKVDDTSRLDRYLRSLTYAITDRRLLILEGDKIYSEYTPEKARKPFLRDRAPGYSDVIFDDRSTRSQLDNTESRDPVYRERRRVGFKALPDAKEVQQRIIDWIKGYQEEAAQEVADFVEAAPSRQRSERLQGAQHIENRVIGLELDAPEEWQVQVRQKKKPQGKMFIDKEVWQEPSTASAWNFIRVEGPSHCKIEVEVFETAPTVTFDKLANSKLADSIAGKVIDSQSDCEINGLRGFFVTRRNDIQVDSRDGGAGIAAVVAPERHTVLHDGKRQIYVISTWPEKSEDLQRAVDAVVESIQIN